MVGKFSKIFFLVEEMWSVWTLWGGLETMAAKWLDSNGLFSTTSVFLIKSILSGLSSLPYHFFLQNLEARGHTDGQLWSLIWLGLDAKFNNRMSLWEENKSPQFECLMKWKVVVCIQNLHQEALSKLHKCNHKIAHNIIQIHNNVVWDWHILQNIPHF
jgi:hypothetical protein